MADENETIADIRKEAEAEFRYLAETHAAETEALMSSALVLNIMQRFNRFFDRIEAAAKREVDALMQQIPRPDPDWTKICEKCHEDGCSEPPNCKYFGEPNGCNSPLYGQHPVEATRKLVD